MAAAGWGKAIAAALALGLALATGTPAAASESRASLEEAALSLRPGQYLWRDLEPGSGAVSAVVSLPLQVIYVFRGDTLIGVASVSTGTAGHRTPTGAFTVLQKQVFHRSNLYSNAPMPFMQRLTWGGIALHAGYNPGYPASHGCIRLPRSFAKLLFDATKLGAPVAIVNGEWSVPEPEEEFPVIIANANELMRSPDFATVTFTPRREAPDRQFAEIGQLPVPAALRVRGDEWLVPDARLIIPQTRRR